MPFNFTNIASLETRMVQQNVEIAFFNVTYGVHNCVIECAYSLNQKKFIFGFVNTTIGFTCTLTGTTANTILRNEISTQLANCRDGTGNWRPSDFFEVLNNHLPNIGFTQITQQQYIGIYTVASDFNDRIYFNHWRRSGMSDKQEKKTIDLMGDHVVDYCHQNGIIPVFYPTPTGRTFDVATDYIADFNNHGFTQNP